MKNKNNLLISRVEELLEIERKFHSFFHINPTPTWLKLITQEKQLVMAMVNGAYTLATSVSINAYRGRTDDDIWDIGEAANFMEIEKFIIRTGVPKRIVEKAINPRTDKVQFWVGWKWPCMHQGEIIGVWGQAEPYSEEFWALHGESLVKALKDIP